MINSFKNGTVVGADFVLSAESLGKSISEFTRDVTYGIFVLLQTLTNLVLTIFSMAKYFADDTQISDGLSEN